MNEKLSDQAVKILEGSLNEIHELDVCEQNRLIDHICRNLLERRKETLMKMEAEKEDFVIRTDEFVKILQSIS